MPRKSTRQDRGLDDGEMAEVPRMPLSRVTKVYKRPKKDPAAINGGKENNINVANKMATEDQLKKADTQKKANKKKEETKKKEEPATKKRSQKKVQKNDEEQSQKLDPALDFLQSQKAYFDSVDEFELTVVEQLPQECLPSITPSRLPALPTKSRESPFLKELIEQEFKKQEKHTQKETKQPQLHDIFDEGADTEDYYIRNVDESRESEIERTNGRANGRRREAESDRESETERDAEEGDKSELFAYDDFNKLVDELDAELSYLHAPKAPPKPFFPTMRSVDPTESDFFPPTPAGAAPPTPFSISSVPPTPASVAPPPRPQRSPRYAYQEYKIVVGLVGTPMSFEEFMARQKRT